MRLSITVGTATENGQIKPAATPDLHIRLIEWHARATNKSNVCIGGSDVSAIIGRHMVPGERLTWDFSNMGENNEPGHLLFSTMYIFRTNGGDKLDWTIFTTDE